MGTFEKGHAKLGGRRKGVRNRLSNALLEALAKDFEEHGVGAVRITRKERPHEYLKIVASLLPKEFEITDSRLTDLSDNELDAVDDLIAQLAAGREADDSSGEGPTLN